MGMKKRIDNYQLSMINGRTVFVSCLLLLSSLSTLVAQDFKRDFKKAKELYNDGNYSSSMDAFKALMVYDRNNPYPEYACFYYALSAHRLGFAVVAKEMFVQTKKIYPEWDQLDDI